MVIGRMSASQIINLMREAPKLEEFSYDRWSADFLNVLTISNLVDHVQRVKPELLSRHNKSISQRDRIVQEQDQFIRIAISQLVPDKLFHLVGSDLTAKECWDNIRQFYCPSPLNDLDKLLEEFWMLESDDNMDVGELVLQLSDIRSKVNIKERGIDGYAIMNPKSRNFL